MQKDSDVNAMKANKDSTNVPTSADAWINDDGNGDEFTEKLEAYEEYNNKIKEYDKELADLNAEYKDDLENSDYLDKKEDIEKKKKKTQKELDKVKKYLGEKSAQWSEDKKGIEYIPEPTDDTEKTVNEYLDIINDAQDKMAIITGGKNAKTNAFNRVVDNWQFDEVVQGLQDLGKEGKVTAEMLDDPKYDEFIQKLVYLGIIDSADNLEDIALAFNKMGKSTDDASDSTSDYTEKLEKLKDAEEKVTDILKEQDLANLKYQFEQANLELEKLATLIPI